MSCVLSASTTASTNAMSTREYDTNTTSLRSAVAAPCGMLVLSSETGPIGQRITVVKGGLDQAAGNAPSNYRAGRARRAVKQITTDQMAGVDPSGCRTCGSHAA